MQCQTVTETQRKGETRDLYKDRKTESEDETERDCVGGGESKNNSPLDLWWG